MKKFVEIFIQTFLLWQWNCKAKNQSREVYLAGPSQGAAKNLPILFFLMIFRLSFHHWITLCFPCVLIHLFQKKKKNRNKKSKWLSPACVSIGFVYMRIYINDKRQITLTRTHHWSLVSRYPFPLFCIGIHHHSKVFLSIFSSLSPLKKRLCV